MRAVDLRINIEVGGVPAWISAGVFLPVRPAQPSAVLFCFPGGGVTRAYFDMQGETRFSFVRIMTDLGHVCACFDHPGCGGSSVPEEGFALSADAVAAAGAAAARQVISMLETGDRLPALPRFRRIGVGHSMGAMVVALQQAEEQLYDGAALLCFSTRGLPEVLTEQECLVADQPVRLEADYQRLARARFGTAFPKVSAVRADSAAGRAVAQVQGAMPACCAIRSMLPGNIAEEARRISVPLFLAAGERDMTGPPHAIPAAFPNCDDMHLTVVRGAGHHPFVADGVPFLYARLAEWLAAQANRADA